MAAMMIVFVRGERDDDAGHGAAVVPRGVHTVAEQQLIEQQGTRLWGAADPFVLAWGSAAVGCRR